MNIARFFEHWGLRENPFSAEEARHDAVFAQLPMDAAAHPDFEKILGDLQHPATSIVFGEKGSGKTAIRMRLAQRIESWNGRRPDERVLLIAYDDLNPVLDRFVARTRRAGTKTVGAALEQFTLADHMDAILHLAVREYVNRCVGGEGVNREDSRELLRSLRRADPTVRSALMALQSVYDDPALAPQRTRKLRRLIRAPYARSRQLWLVLTWVGWMVPAAAAAWLVVHNVPSSDPAWMWGVGGVIAAWLLVILKHHGFDGWRLRSLGRKLARHVHVLERHASSYAQSLFMLPTELLSAGSLPIDSGDESRYVMFDRLRRIAPVFGHRAIIIVVDRIDEPTVISGDPDRMRRIAWPLFSSTFLQVEGFGVKLLLPLELRHALFRESSAFFQEARLDKQNLIEQLSWTGSTLYDLCTERLRICRDEPAEPIALADLFDDEVTRRDVVDALDQMRQPRDAFKLLYQCILEHCANVTDEAALEDGVWRIPRLILDTVRRQQADRVLQLSRGMRPA